MHGRRVQAIRAWLLAVLWTLAACSKGAGAESSVRGTAPPPGGWANHAPTLVARVVHRDDAQLLEVKQGALATWVRIPKIGAAVGDYVLLGQGTVRHDVELPELGVKAAELVDIAHARAVDRETAERAVATRIPDGAIGVKTVFEELDRRAGQEVIVYGVVTKDAGAIGYHWVHLSDSTGDPSASDYDLTVKTKEGAAEGTRVAYRGRLRKDVDLGFGYHYDALVEDAVFVDSL